ncbi:MAG: glycyl-radical enzyme activating protein [Candidatus Riflebacteria bacterium]|nr:glycyl-radical enzyme activating protein [Candidatus Riflebacteria bacterium]
MRKERVETTIYSSTGIIFDIQSFSLHDGPGTRTTFFLKGCGLQCNWCANPEGISPQFSLFYREKKCCSCGICAKFCKFGAIAARSHEKIKINRNLCAKCEIFQCAQVCPNEALSVCGKTLTFPKFDRIIHRDRQYWDRKGGVTFSGGEPLFQKQFLEDALKFLIEKSVHVALETSAFSKKQDFLEIVKLVDFLFIDIKNIDNDKHIEQTGVSNQIIFENLSSLSKSDFKGRAIVRIPLIAGFNDDEICIDQVAGLMTNLGMEEINLLPYHSFGETKWAHLGLNYKCSGTVSPGSEVIERIKRHFEEKKIRCYIGSETDF